MTVQTPRRLSRPPTFSFGLAALAAGLVVAAGAHAGSIDPPHAQAAAARPGSVAKPQAARVPLDPLLERSFAGGGKADLLVTLHEKADLSPAFAMDWNTRGRWVYRTLKETADRSQAPLKRALEARGAHVESNWITNTLIVRDGERAVAEAAQRSALVASVIRLPTSRAIEPDPVAKGAAPRTDDGIPANIRQVRAPLAWADGTTGAGVTVGLIDHGPLLEHEALSRQFRGWRGDGAFDYDYNWFDPQTPRPPMGDGNHGSHVLGIMIGDNHAADPGKRERTGVAPGAQWIGCEAFPQDTPTTIALLRCAQFMLAPTKMDGSAPDPDQRPAVVNNSWFTYDTCNGGGDSAFRGAIDAWVAAGIVPVFAQGNTQSCDMTQPPGLQSVPAPASLASVFAVGSSGNHDGLYAPHSMWGPTTDASSLANLPDPRGFPQLKPQVVAPGVTIRSVASSPGQYITSTGTSMAAPHVAGTVALMLDAGPCLRGDYARIGTILMQTARGISYDTGGTPPPGPGNVPNYATGWGELDAYAAANAAAAACGPQGFVRGRVRNAAGNAIAGAIVEIFDSSATPAYRLTTEADGGYTRRLPERTGAGYRVRVSAYGYLANDEAGLIVATGSDTQHDVTLANATMKTLSGTVRDAATGWPLHARIAIDGRPDVTWTDPVSGFYAIALPAGTPFRFDVTSEVPGYQPRSREIADVAAANGDFTLDADLVRCMAPGYTYGSRLLQQNFESNGSALPPGWTRSSAGVGWLFGDTVALSEPSNPLPPHGRYAASNDMAGPEFGSANDGRYDYLVLPPLNLAGVTAPVLRFASYWPESDGRSRAAVEGSRDGGATWQALGRPRNATDAGDLWSEEVISLAALAGAGDARVRFHADDGTTGDASNTGAPWAVDDVDVRAACTAPVGGGLVVGHVRDANDAAALDGADVRIGNGASVSTAKSADPAVGSGFYVTHAAAGAQTAHASRGTNPAGYADAQANVTLAAGSVAVADLALGAGRLRVYPSAGPTATLPLGTTRTATFTVRNHGSEPLAFALQQAPVEEHFDDPALFPPAGWNATGETNCPWRLLNWNEINLAGGDTYAAVADGAGCWEDTSPYDVTLYTPRLDLSTSQSAAVGFFVSFGVGTGTPRLDLDVSADGGATWHTEWSVASDLSSEGPGTLIERDLSAYAGASDVRVRFRVTAPLPAGRAVIDQVHLFNSASSSPWVDFSPDGAALAAGATRDVTATFDARSVPQPGVYAVPLRIAHDTPYDLPYGDVQASMTVTAPSGWGALAGTVRSLGECDVHPEPLVDAQVEISNAQGNTYTTTTDAGGRYRYWRPASEGPFRITVQAPWHEGRTVTSLAIAAGAETTTDIGLRALMPCITTTPAALSADVATGQSTSKTFDVVNLGPAQGGWSLQTGGDPTVRVPRLITQTGAPEPADGWSIGCQSDYGATLTTTFLRVFPLAASTDTSDYLTISGIEFGIGDAHSPDGTQPAFARLYALDGELRNENLRLLREQPFSVPDATLARQRVRFDSPLTLPRTTVLVAAIHVPTGTGLGRALYMGTNQSGESAPGYWTSPDCEGLEQPSPTSDIGRGFAMLLDIEMQTSDACGAGATPVSWLAVSPASGQVAGDGGATAQAAFNASGLPDGTHQGALCLASPNTLAPVPVPVTLRVGASDLIFRSGFEP